MPKFNVDFFLKKFGAIPKAMWQIGWDSGISDNMSEEQFQAAPRCALSHTGSKESLADFMREKMKGSYGWRHDYECLKPETRALVRKFHRLRGTLSLNVDRMKKDSVRVSKKPEQVYEVNDKSWYDLSRGEGPKDRILRHLGKYYAEVQARLKRARAYRDSQKSVVAADVLVKEEVHG